MSLLDQMKQFLFQESQADADTEAALREADEAERLKTQRTPLVKALKDLGIDGADVQIDEVGAWLKLPSAEKWHEAVRSLGSIEAMNTLADQGWVCEFAGDVADTTEPTEFTINFLCIHSVEPSEQDKATPVNKLNKEVQGGSDTVIPPEQAKRDKERAHGVSEEIRQAADQLLVLSENSPPVHITPRWCFTAHELAHPKLVEQARATDEFVANSRVIVYRDGRVSGRYVNEAGTVTEAEKSSAVDDESPVKLHPLNPADRVAEHWRDVAIGQNGAPLFVEEDESIADESKRIVDSMINDDSESRSN